MTAQDFLSLISELIYLAMFVIAAAALLRTRSLVALDTFLFFGAITTLLLIGNAADLMGLTGNQVIGDISWIGVAALPYLLLRLVDDFRPQRTWLMLLAPAVFLIVSAIGVVVPQPWPVQVSLVLVAYVVVFGSYASVAFLREAGHAQGVTRRRMQAVALASGLLALVILLAGVQMILPGTAAVIGLATQLIGLGIVVSYFVGFAPPGILRRAWQEPAIRALMADAADLVQLADPHAIATRIEESALAASGAQGAAVGLWDEASGQLTFRSRFGEVASMPPGEGIGGRAFVGQRAIYTHRAERDAPERAAEYRRHGIRAIAAAPITSGDRRLGVLVVYAARPARIHRGCAEPDLAAGRAGCAGAAQPPAAA